MKGRRTSSKNKEFFNKQKSKRYCNPRKKQHPSFNCGEAWVTG